MTDLESAPEDIGFRRGTASSGHVTIRVERHEFPNSASYEDRNWIQATIEVAGGAFRGTFVASLRTDDFPRFSDQLRPLDETLFGNASFTTMEGWLSIEIEGDGRGHFHADCAATDNAATPPTGVRLTFGIDFNQTELPAILRRLQAIRQAFPIQTRPT